MMRHPMTPGSPEDSSPPWKEVHRAVLAMLEALAKSTGWIQTAVSIGVDPIFQRVLQQACAGPRVAPAAYLDTLSLEPELRAQVQERLSRLMAHPELLRRRREAQRREAEHQLYSLRYTLSGVEPPAHVWEALEAREQARLRKAAESAEERDSVLLSRVERALERLAADDAYGVCEGCQTPIVLERLQIIPWAEYCTPCQRERDNTPAEPPPSISVVYF
jgi:RNA polymerase-binding transcription factor DksA